MNKRLEAKIEKFLTERKKSAGGYAPVTDKEIDQLYHIVEELIKAKYQQDGDGDLPVEVTLINRNTHQRLHYLPVPYTHKAESIEDMVRIASICATNSSIACEEYKHIPSYMRDMLIRQKDKK